MSYSDEVKVGNRFAFGKNWSKYSRLLSDAKILNAIESLKAMLGVDSLKGKTFLDVGCGSGLFSLAAVHLGAKVFSFDYDSDSVACTQRLKHKYFPDKDEWKIEIGSVLDKDYMISLGKFDIVYSWGVLHHTGDMANALTNVDYCVSVGGKLFIAIYNYQPFFSNYWKKVKILYNKFVVLRPLIIFVHLIYPIAPSLLLKFVTKKNLVRGMNWWYDLLDWLGGYPFEVSKPEGIFEFYKHKGYMLIKLITVGGRLGCNEFVFQKY